MTWRAKGINIHNNVDEVRDSQETKKYEVDGTDLLIRNLDRDDEGSYLCKAVQNVVNEDGVIKYSDFKDFVINVKIERKFGIVLITILSGKKIFSFFYNLTQSSSAK